MMRRWLPIVMTLPLWLAGCDGGDEQAEEHAEHEGGEHEGGEHEGGEHEGGEHEGGEHEGSATDTHGEEGDCAAEDRDDEFSVGLSKSGELVTATFVSATPAPPIKGDNAWVLDFADLSGEPLEELDIVVIPMMPDHGHGTPVEAVVTPTEVAGQYEVTPVNMFMTGYGEVHLELTLAGGEQDTLMFGFCVE